MYFNEILMNPFQVYFNALNNKLKITNDNHYLSNLNS